MRKIINPWAGKGVYSCFGCADDNSIGLHLHFYDDGEGLVCNWTPGKNHEGYINTLHGGIQSTLHDEIASWLVYVKGQTAGMTTELNVKFFKSVLVSDGEIKITGRIKQHERKFIKMHTQLFNKKGELCSEAEVVYRVLSQQMAIEKMHYPGVDAFYED